MQWIYTEYLSIYTQYLGYFTSILVLLISAVAISLIKIVDKKRWWVISFFSLSLILGVIDIYLVFEIYDWLRTMLLLMSGQCTAFSNDIVCDVNIQEHSSYLKTTIIFMILSFIFLIIGYVIKVRGAHAK